MSQKQVKRIRRTFRIASQGATKAGFARLVEGALGLEPPRYHRLIRRTLRWFENWRSR